MYRNNNGCLPLFCAIIGMLILGPIGAILGFLLGRFFNIKRSTTIDDGVLYNISALFAAVMKADHQIMQSELYSFRDFFLQHFGQNAASQAIDYLKELKDKDIQIQEHAARLNLKLNYTERLEILRYLFQLSYVDNDMSSDELEIIQRIAQYFQIRQTDYDYIRNTYQFYQQQQNRQGYYSNYSGSYGSYSSLNADYALLGVKSSDSDDVIKKAYRRLAVDNHPDKVAHLGENARKEAEARFAKINEAYQRIKKARNL